jgi:hypothetical protein
VGQSHRSLKVADRIKVVVAQILETKIKDPVLVSSLLLTRELLATYKMHQFSTLSLEI